MRLYDPTLGRITLRRRRPARDVAGVAARQIGVVFQESFLFNATVRENIAARPPRREPGRDRGGGPRRPRSTTPSPRFPTATTPSSASAAAGSPAASASASPSPAPFCATRGSWFSTRRRRRSIPAPRPRSPRRCRGSAAGRTVISVTHRLASVVDADCIHVLDQGRVVESGRHAELLARHGHYARLWAKQSGFQLSEEGDVATVSPARLRQVPLFDQLDDDDPRAGGVAVRHRATPRRPDDHPPGRRGRPVLHPGARHGGDRWRPRTTRAGASPSARTATTSARSRCCASVPRTASVRTLTPCTLLSLQRRQFDVLLQHAPQLRGRMEAVHTARLTSSHRMSRRNDPSSSGVAFRESRDRLRRVRPGADREGHRPVGVVRPRHDLHAAPRRRPFRRPISRSWTATPTSTRRAASSSAGTTAAT